MVGAGFKMGVWFVPAQLRTNAWRRPIRTTSLIRCGAGSVGNWTVGLENDIALSFLSHHRLGWGVGYGLCGWFSRLKPSALQKQDYCRLSPPSHLDRILPFAESRLEGQVWLLKLVFEVGALSPTEVGSLSVQSAQLKWSYFSLCQLMGLHCCWWDSW